MFLNVGYLLLLFHCQVGDENRPQNRERLTPFWTPDRSRFCADFEDDFGDRRTDLKSGSKSASKSPLQNGPQSSIKQNTLGHKSAGTLGIFLFLARKTLTKLF